jgi:hypothetical protein
MARRFARCAPIASPADVAKKLGVPEAVMTIISSGELTAKKIGTSYRITRGVDNSAAR